VTADFAEGAEGEGVPMPVTYPWNQRHPWCLSLAAVGDLILYRSESYRLPASAVEAKLQHALRVHCPLLKRELIRII